MVLGSGDVETRDLTIEAITWPATVTFGVGDQSGCSRSGGRWEDGTWIPAPAIKLVGFHNASGKYTVGQRVATACRYYEESEWKSATGMFTVRIWGKLCLKGPTNAQRCWDLKNPTPPAGLLAIARFGGYRATFAPGPNCGPARTVEGLESQPPYAAWCDSTVDTR